MDLDLPIWTLRVLSGLVVMEEGVTGVAHAMPAGTPGPEAIAAMQEAEYTPGQDPIELRESLGVESQGKAAPPSEATLLEMPEVKRPKVDADMQARKSNIYSAALPVAGLPHINNTAGLEGCDQSLSATTDFTRSTIKGSLP